jgi:methyl-accepting chemotaxis protein
MKWNVGTRIAVGFGLVVVIFTLVGVMSYRTTKQLMASAQARQHTYDVLYQIEDMLSSLKDVVRAQRGYTITGDQGYLEPYNEAVKSIEPGLQQLQRLTSDNQRQQRRVEQLDAQVKACLAFNREVIELRRTGGFEPALQLVRNGKGEALMNDVARTATEMTKDEKELLATRNAATESASATAQRMIIIGTTGAVLLALAVGVVITRSIVGPLRSLTVAADRITLGDLNVQVSVAPRDDEVGLLALAFDRMTRSLRTMAAAAEQIAAGDLRASVTPQSAQDTLGKAFARMSEQLREQMRQLVEGANVLGAAASEIVASTAQLASTAAQSATAVSETTTTVEEVRQTAELASQKARSVSDTAQRAAQISLGGRKSTEDLVAGMSRIRQQMEAIAASMARLSEQSQAIGLIIATVEDLAAQSNLLAVNAAIEAAKAGEQGKGFGVVAQEVRSLADQSRQATNQVRALLSEIQKATATAVLATEQGGKAVETGSRHTDVAGESIQSLTGSVTEAAQAATQIAASSQQQLVGVDQVVTAMESIKQATNQNVASARQLETSARNLQELGLRLKQMVAGYKV